VQVFNVLSVEQDPLQSQRQNILQFVPEDAVAVAEVGAVAGAGSLRGSWGRFY
jgi:hypothetical protein